MCKLLYSGRSLTDIAHEAGLSDSAHLSHFYRHWYGQSPSYSRDRESVKFFS
ncbi:helix-turn-helix domain-containing protein [Variovorax sp. UC122_21]|uniref:helix-turn-helix domain-containing protein n=1 Tax=Variovorax sp. UC122_21 TaxID=3374554 RepID=UPI003756D79B